MAIPIEAERFLAQRTKRNAESVDNRNAKYIKEEERDQTEKLEFFPKPKKKRYRSKLILQKKTKLTMKTGNH